MDKLDTILSTTSLFPVISELGELYSMLDAESSLFAEKSGIRCGKGCGGCCEGYVPSVTEAEALYAAYCALKDGREEEIRELLARGKESGRCPFYLTGRDLHCAFYRGRSMVCRIFGSASYRDKNGSLVWKDCRWREKDREDVRISKEAEASFVDSSFYGARLMEISGDGTMESIYDALPKALDRIGLVLTYCGKGD